MAIVLRLTKGSALTFSELDGNFTDLDTRVSTNETDIAALQAAPTPLFATNNLSDLANLATSRVNLFPTPTLNHFIVGTGTDWTSTTPAASATALGLGTADCPTFTGVNGASSFDFKIASSAEATLTAGILTFESGASDPSLAWTVDGILAFRIAGLSHFQLTSTAWEADNIAGPAMLDEAATVTNPTVVPEKSDFTSGMGAPVAGGVTLITSGITRLNLEAFNTTLVSVAGSGAVGGTMTITAGQGGVTFAGGAVSIAGGAGGATSGDGGAVNINGGATTTSGEGGAVTITGGSSAASAGDDGADVALIGGTGNQTGGVARVQGGVAGTNSNGGEARLLGAAGNGSGNGGVARITGGAGGTTGAGADVLITSGGGGATSGNSGNVTLNTGGVTSGTVGDILFNRNSVAAFEIDATGGTAGFRGADAGGPAILNEASSNTNPTLIPDRADLTTGVGGVDADQSVTLIGAGVALLIADGDAGEVLFINQIHGNTAGSGGLQDETPSNVNPTVVPRNNDLDSGVGSNAADQPNMIAGAIEGTRWEEASSEIIQVHQTTTGLTANAGGGQGSATPLLSSFNDVTTVATAGDSVVLPAAALGRQVWVFNADAADAMDVFPAVGDDLGAGVNTAVSVAAGTGAMFMAIDATNWRQFI